MKTVKISNQEWSNKNLDISKFRNGEEILEVNSKDEWWDALDKKIPAYCNYEFNASNGDKYGKIYNWHAIADDKGLAPEGFRSPSNADWTLLTDNIGGPESALKLIDIGDESTSNETGFSALPGGYFDAADEGDFYSEGGLVIFWSFEKPEMLGSHIDFNKEPEPFYFDIEQDEITIDRGRNSAASVISCGYYVRCIKE